MTKRIMWMLTVPVLLYAGCCGYLFLAQRSLIYFPVPAATPVAADDIRIEVDGAVIQVWRLHAGAADAILYFGGNAEDVSQNIPQFSRWFPDNAVYLVNYRGYGASSGKPTEADLVADAALLFDRISERHDNVTVIGRSLGSGVAVQLASNRQPDRIVLITPFDSIASVAQAAFPIFPVGWLLHDRYDSIARAAAVSVPVLMLIAERDEVIPVAHSEKLAAALEPALLTVRMIAGATHNTIHLSDEYAASLRAFLQ